MPVALVSGADGQTAEKTCGDSTGAVLGQGVHARRCGGPGVLLPASRHLYISRQTAAWLD